MGATKDLEAPLLEPQTEEEECEGGVWGIPSRPVPVKANGSAAETGEKADKSGLCAAVFTLCISIPALVGSWCWPMLVAGILGVATTSVARSLAHSVSFGITLALITNIAQYTYHKCAPKKKGSHLQRYGPFYLTLAAVPLIMADLTRHVLQDADMISLSMYRDGCPNHEGFKGITCLSGVGWLFTIILTYSGFICLIVGTFWAANIVGKVKAAWGNIRAATGK